MQEINFDEVIDRIVMNDNRYSRDAYHFIREALTFTQRLIAKKNKNQVRHVSGQELLDGIREFALQEYGPMTHSLLQEWGIHHCSDFGELVFGMVEAGLLRKTETDSREDFGNGYDFQEAFVKPFLPSQPLANPNPDIAGSPPERLSHKHSR